MHVATGWAGSEAMTKGESEAVEKLKRVAEVGEVIICVRGEDGELRPIFQATEQDVAYWKIIVQIFEGVAGLKMIGDIARRLLIALSIMLAVIMLVNGKIRLSDFFGALK
jgi:hypothetical protein